MRDLLEGIFRDPAAEILKLKGFPSINTVKNKGLSSLIGNDLDYQLDFSDSVKKTHEVIGNIPINIVALTYISQYTEEDKEDRNFIVYYILASYISWTKLQNTQYKDKIIFILLGCLKNYSNNLIIKDTFCYLLQIYYYMKNHDNEDEITEIVLDFLQDHLDQTISKLIPALIQVFDSHKFLQNISKYILPNITFSQDFYTDLIYSMNKYLHSLEQDSLMAVKVIIPFLSSKNQKNLVRDLLSSFITIFQKTQNCIDFDPPQLPPASISNDEEMPSFNNLSFNGGEREMTYNNENIMFNKELEDLILSIVDTLSVESTLYTIIITTLIEFYPKAIEQHRFGDMYYLTLLTCEFIHNKSQKPPLFSEYILSPHVFGPFSNKFSHTLRLKACQLVFKEGALSIANLFSHCALYPSLFAEICIIIMEEEKSLNYLTDSKVIETITSSLIQARILRSKGDKNGELVLLSVIELLRRIFPFAEDADNIIENTKFVESFLYSIFETNIRRTVLSLISKYYRKEAVLNALRKIIEETPICAEAEQMIFDILVLIDQRFLINNVIHALSKFESLSTKTLNELISKTHFCADKTEIDFKEFDKIITKNSSKANELAKELIEFSSDFAASDFESPFEIKYENVYKTFVTTYNQSFNHVLIEAKFSDSNCLKIHRTGIDSFLLSKASENYDSVIPVLRIVSGKYCSSKMVQQYISQIRDPSIFDLVHSMTADALLKPMYYSMLISKHKLSFPLINTESEKGICITLFLLCRNADTKTMSDLCSVTDQNGISIHIESYGNIIQIADNIINAKKTVFMGILELNTVNNLSITIQNNKIKAFINGSQAASFDLEFNTSSISGTFAGEVPGSIDCDTPSIMGISGIFKYNEKLTRLKKPSHLRKFEHIVLYDTNEIHSKDFTFCLIKQCGFPVIYHIFDIADTTENMIMCLDILEDCLDQLDNFDSFKGANSFDYLSKVLIENGIINFTIYMKLYRILESLISYKAKKKLISLFLDFNIWLRMSENDQISMFTHIVKVLIPNFSNIFFKGVSFSSILFKIVFYIDSNDFEFREKFIKTSVSTKLLDVISDLLFQIAAHSFNEEDLTNLVGYIQVSNYQTSFLNLLERISQIEPSPFINIRSAPILYNLISNKESVSYLFKVIWNLSKKNAIEGKFDAHMMTITQMMPNLTMTEFNQLLEMLKDCPLMLLPCCWATSKMGPQATKELCQVLTGDDRFTHVPGWVAWILLICPAAIDSSKEMLMNLLAVAGRFEIQYVYAAIGVIGSILGFEIEIYRSQYLKAITAAIMRGQIELSPQVASEYNEVIKSFLFFRESTKSSDLAASFIDSPFADSIDVADIIKPKVYSSSNGYESFIDKLKDFEYPEIKYRFGLRLDGNGDWLDRELCANVLLIIENTDYLNTNLMMCYFLHRFNPNDVMDNIRRLRIDLGKVSNIGEIILFRMAQTEKGHISPESFLLTFEDFIQDSDPSFHDQSVAFATVASQYIRDCLLKIDSKKCIINEGIDSTALSIMDNARRINKSYKKLKNLLDTSVLLEDKNPHYKRDKTECFARCPFKLKRNFEFNQHEGAMMKSDHEVRVKVKAPKHRIFGVRKGSNFNAKYISITGKQHCIVSFSKKDIIIYRPGKSKRIKLSEIESIRPIKYLHVPNAINIFTKNRIEHVIAFNSETDKNSALKLLDHRFLPTIDIYTKKWQKGSISNFEYLMIINNFANRTFRYSSQYPILPFIIADYTSKELDLSNPASFRDLSKPIGALNQTRFERYKQLMERLAESEQPAHLYGCAPQNPLTLFLFFFIIEPFTSLHIDIQGGHFDLPERIFASISDLYRAITTDMNDFRELIPEFFFLEDFLMNRSHYVFGNGIEDVAVPTWAISQFDFIYQNRKALESEFVSKHISEWIDLLFGVNQHSSNNIYSSELYESVWTPETMKDPHRAKSIELQMKHFGQVPTQIFKELHPQKSPSSNSMRPIVAKLPNISFGTIIGSTFYVLKDGSIQHFKLDDADFQYHMMSLPDNPILVAGGGDIAERKNGVTITGRNIGKFVLFAASKDIAVITTEDHQLKILGPHKISIPFLDPPPKAITISDTFQTIAIASKERVYLIDTSGEIVRHLDAPDVMFLSITPCWGFIVAVSLSKLRVFTINGVLISELNLPFTVSCMATFRSQSAFDFVAIGTEDGQVYAFEAYNPSGDIGKTLVRTGERVLAVGFHRSRMCVSFLCAHKCGCVPAQFVI